MSQFKFKTTLGALLKRYDQNDLADPATYKQDPELMALAGQVAAGHYETHGRPAFSRGGFREAVQAGQFPELVLHAVQRAADARRARETALAEGRETAAGIVPPAGYRLTIEGETLALSGPWSDDLHARVKRAGGQWDGKSGQNRRVWLIPLGKAASLKRIFRNSAKAAAEKQAAAEQAERERAAQREIRQREVLMLREQARQRAAEERASRAPVARRAQQRALFPCGDAAPALHVPLRWRGQLVVFESAGDPFRINEGHPSTHGSHLLGHEGDRGRYYYYRPATVEETAVADRAEAAVAARGAAERDRQTQLAVLRGRFRAEGERPTGHHRPEGECVADTRTPYGGGEWFVLGVAWIWYVQNNGADGDDWSLNNVVTGGAGAIGWRLPHDPDLAESLRGAGGTPPERGDA